MTNYRRSSRGFSLIELMAVVTITAILALAGVAMFRRHLLAAKGAEATSVIQAIRSAEESYLSENHIYLNVSTASGGNQWFPTLVPGNLLAKWPQASSGHVDWPRWQKLAPSVKQSVRFGYLVNAGLPNSTIPTLQIASPPAAFSAPQPLDWYVIQARGDTDGNGVFATYASSNMTPEVYIENEGE